MSGRSAYRPNLIPLNPTAVNDFKLAARAIRFLSRCIDDHPPGSINQLTEAARRFERRARAAKSLFTPEELAAAPNMHERVP